MPLTTSPGSSLARQTVRTAYEELERAITPAESSEFRSKTLEDVRKAAIKIEEELGARQCLRNMRRLVPLFRGLEHYSRTAEILCNGTPYLPWLWAPITLILRIASEYVEAFEQIIKAYSRIADSLSRFEYLNAAFATEHGFQQILAIYYADILEFHKNAYKFVRRSGWKLFFMTSWGRFQRRFGDILEDLERHEALIDKEANARNIFEAQRMWQDMRTWREERLVQSSRAEEEQAAKQYQAIMSWLKMDDSDQLAIFDAIFAEGAKYPGTCEWILSNAKVKSWLQQKPDMPMLWLQGTPGSGKSVLSTQLINFARSAGYIVLYHFCTFSYASSVAYDQLLRSLLLQLLCKDGELIAHIYEECVLARKPSNVTALEHILQTLLKGVSNNPSRIEYVWVILDGVDECDPDKQARIARLMSQLTLKSSALGTVCKVLISSRASPTLSKRLSKKQTLSLTEEKGCLAHAIQNYASFRLKSITQVLAQLHVGPAEVEDIEGEIVRKADGMFLYARLVLDYLATNIFYSGAEIMASINQLPRKLMDFYQKTLTQIVAHLDERSVARVRCIFGWIAFAKRPLRKLEFLSAVSFTSGDSRVSNLVPEYILNICSSFIEERRDASITFVHVSVKDFLQTPSCIIAITEREAINQHGVASLTCLLSSLEVLDKSYDEHDRCIRLIKGIHGLHVYATEYWTEYVLSYAESHDTLDTNAQLIVLATQLSRQLGQAVSPTLGHELDTMPKISDDRLASLRTHMPVYKLVENSLGARSAKQLESDLLENAMILDNSSNSHGISALLKSYQEAIRFLLSQSSYSGVSAEEFELFKSAFRNSAYTCRLSSCPWATLGFESENLLLEHELTHIRRFRCTWSGCKYPPLPSVQSLKNHVKKYHNPIPHRNPIRKVPPTFEGFKDGHRQRHESISAAVSQYVPKPLHYSAEAKIDDLHPSLTIEIPSTKSTYGASMTTWSPSSDTSAQGRSIGAQESNEFEQLIETRPSGRPANGNLVPEVDMLLQQPLGQRQQIDKPRQMTMPPPPAPQGSGGPQYTNPWTSQQNAQPPPPALPNFKLSPRKGKKRKGPGSPVTSSKAKAENDYDLGILPPPPFDLGPPTRPPHYMRPPIPLSNLIEPMQIHRFSCQENGVQQWAAAPQASVASAGGIEAGNSTPPEDPIENKLDLRPPTPDTGEIAQDVDFDSASRFSGSDQNGPVNGVSGDGQSPRSHAALALQHEYRKLDRKQTRAYAQAQIGTQAQAQVHNTHATNENRYTPIQYNESRFASPPTRQTTPLQLQHQFPSPPILEPHQLGVYYNPRPPLPIPREDPDRLRMEQQQQQQQQQARWVEEDEHRRSNYARQYQS